MIEYYEKISRRTQLLKCNDKGGMLEQFVISLFCTTKETTEFLICLAF